MAPRRGGGSSSGGSSIDNQCSDYGAFASDYAKAQIAILGVVLFLFLVLAYCVKSRSTKRKKAGEGKGILRWYHYGIALFLVIAYFIITIIHYSLAECGVINRTLDNDSLNTATIIAGFLSDYWLLGIIFFVVINKMFLLAGSSAIRRVLKIVNIVAFVIAFVIAASALIMNLVYSWRVRGTRTNSYILTYSRLWQASVVLYVILSVLATVGLILAWIRVSRRPEVKQGIAGWIPVLIICILGYSLYNAIIVFLSIYSDSEIDPIGSIAGWAIAIFFFFFAYFSIFMISRGKGWDWLDPNGPRETYDMTGAHTQPVGYNNVPYDPHAAAEAKRQSSLSYPQASTPAPPYMGAYSGHGVYDNQPQQQGQVYNTGTWGSGGYAPVGATSYNAPPGAASRDMSENELLGRR